MRKNATLGVLIIIIGVIWLLTNLDIFSFNLIAVFFGAMGTLWPLILVGIGISILLRDNSVLRLLIWLIIFVLILVYGIYDRNTGRNNLEFHSPDFNYSQNSDYSISKEPATVEGELNFNFGAGQVNLATIDSNLLQLKSNDPKLRYDHRFQNDKKKIIIDFDKHDYSPNVNYGDLFCNINLHQDIKWDIDLDLGAAKGNLNLKNAAVSKLELDMGAADVDLYLGNKNAQSNINIKAGASNLDIFIPKEAGLKIKLDSALSGDNLSNLGLQKQDDQYISPGYEDREIKYFFDIDMGMGNLNFHQQ